MAAQICAMSEFELLAEPDTNLIVYRYIPESLREATIKQKLTEIDNLLISKFNQRLQKMQRQAGRTFISRTTKTTECFGKEIPIIALRAVLANPLTTKDDIDTVLNDQMQIASEICISDLADTENIFQLQ
jgi:glutamate decarboxylase